MRAVIKWGILVFIVWWVIVDPAGAAAEAQKLAGLASRAATSISTVVSSI